MDGIVDSVINTFGQLPSWVWIVVGIVGVLVAISLIKKAISLAITVGIITLVLSSTGILSNEIIEQGKEKLNMGIDYGKQLYEENKDNIDKAVDDTANKVKESLSDITDKAVDNTANNIKSGISDTVEKQGIK